MRIAIIAAMPGELKPLVKGWRRVDVGVRGTRKWVFSQEDDTWTAVCAGMGADAAQRAFALAEIDGELDMVLSVGWAGALEADMKPGLGYDAIEVIDAETGERFLLPGPGGGVRLVTTPHVASEAEKSRLHQTYGASLVDMEAAVIARLARMRGIPVRCLKAVSDSTNEKLPNLNPFIDARGQLRLVSFLAHIAVRPHYWRPLLNLGRNSDRAAKTLAAMVNKLLQAGDLGKSDRTGAA